MNRPIYVLKKEKAVGALVSGKNRCMINSVQLASSWRDFESGATCTLSWEDRCYSDWRLRRTGVCSLRRLIEWVGPVVTPHPRDLPM